MQNILGTIGIIIPTYNRVDVLKKAINSVLEQTYIDIEVIVMDDCGDAETTEYLKGLMDPRLSYIVNKQNLGLAKNINKGVANLSDKVAWCTILCDDDFYKKDCIDNLVKTAITTKAEAIVHNQIIFVDYNGEYLREARKPPYEESAVEFVKSRATFIKDRYLSGVMFSRKYFEQIGGYPVFASGMAADDAFVFSLSLRDRLVFSPESIVYIRIHSEAESQQLIDIKKHILALKQYREYCINNARLNNISGGKMFLLLVKYLNTHVQEMNFRLWTGSIRQLNKVNPSLMRIQYKNLYKLGLKREFLFPVRVRLSSYTGLITGVCLENIGLYRNFWRQLNKIKRAMKRI